jgi:hypothetical protein
MVPFIIPNNTASWIALGLLIITNLWYIGCIYVAIYRFLQTPITKPRFKLLERVYNIIFRRYIPTFVIWTTLFLNKQGLTINKNINRDNKIIKINSISSFLAATTALISTYMTWP